MMKQEKRSASVMINKPKYHEKCLELLNTDQSTKLNQDPAKKIEAKIQRVLCNIKKKLISQEYSCRYLTDICPGKFYIKLDQ